MRFEKIFFFKHQPPPWPGTNMLLVIRLVGRRRPYKFKDKRQPKGRKDKLSTSKKEFVSLFYSFSSFSWFSQYFITFQFNQCLVDGNYSNCKTLQVENISYLVNLSPAPWKDMTLLSCNLRRCNRSKKSLKIHRNSTINRLRKNGFIYVHQIDTCIDLFLIIVILSLWIQWGD